MRWSSPAFVPIALLLAAASGCRQAADETPTAPATKAAEVKQAAPVVVVNPYQEIDSDTIDTKRFPDLSDKTLPLLKDVPLLRRLILDNAAVTNKGMMDIAELVELKVLFLTGTAVTDDGLALLKNLRNLEELKLDRLRITDAGLVHLKELPELKRLSLWRTLVTDEGLKNLKSLHKLQHLSLDETRVGDEGLNQLHELPELRYLLLWRTKVTDRGVAEFQAQRPLVTIKRG